ncbi:MAG: hypothetical protein H7A45_04055 [Verrucomicrobiales bacterium]|nr:hypothetical protein [Verrucomicrobiales bacterium]
MSLRSPAFEKRLRHRVRAEIRCSRERRKAWRKARLRRRLAAGPVLWFLLVAWCAGMLSALDAGAFTSEIRLAIVALWFLGETAMHLRRLQSEIYGPQALLLLYHLPLADDAILDVQRRRWRWRSVWTLGWYLPFAFALGPIEEWTIASGLVSLGLFLLQGMCARALALHLEAWAPRPVLAYVPALHLGTVGAFALAFSLPPLGGTLGPVAQALTWLPVFGWLNHVYCYAWLGGDPWTWTLLLPVSVVFWTLPWSWRRIQSRFQLPEPLFAATAAEAGWEPDCVEEGVPDQPAGARGVTAIEERIRTRSFLDGESWWTSAGWYERLAVRCLDSRERLLVEVLLGAPPSWTADFWKRLRLAALGGLLILALGQYGGWVFAVALLIGAPVALPLTGGMWPGLQAHSMGGIAAPPFALLPVGFQELTRVLMKLSGLRLVLGFPALALLAASIAWKLEADPRQAAAILMKIAALLGACLPCFAVFQVSAVSNDTQRIRWRTLPLLLLIILTVVGGAAALFFAGTVVRSLLWMAVVAAASLTLRWVYGRAWARGRFDLVSASTPGDGSS